MANPRYNTQVTQPRGSSARVGKMGGGMMKPMYKKGGVVSESRKKQFRDNQKKTKVSHTWSLEQLRSESHQSLFGTHWPSLEHF